LLHTGSDFEVKMFQTSTVIPAKRAKPKKSSDSSSDQQVSVSINSFHLQ